jgi:hypothetical protein
MGDSLYQYYIGCCILFQELGTHDVSGVASIPFLHYHFTDIVHYFYFNFKKSGRLNICKY